MSKFGGFGRFKRTAKEAKKKKRILKDYLNGKAILDDIFNDDGPPVITGMIISNGIDDPEPLEMGPKKFKWFDANEKDDDGPFSWNTKRVPSWYREDIVWHEEKTYPDPEIPDVHYSRKENVPELPQEAITGSNLTDNSNSTESSKRSETKKTKRKSRQSGKMQEAPVIEMKAKEGSQEYLKLKIEEMEKEFAVNLEAHNEAETLNKANSELNVHISKILRF